MKFINAINVVYVSILAIGALFSISVNAQAALDSTESNPAKTGSWEGFYVAGSYGYSKDNGNLESSFSYNGGGLQNINSPLHLTKFVPGIQFGYNYQIDSYILGLEADISPSAISKANCARVSSSGPDCGDGYYGGLNLSEKAKYKGALKLRFGYQLTDIMLYASSGLAYANLSNTLNINCPSGCTPSDANPITSTTTISKNEVRFTYGLGAEYKLDGNWKMGADYFYFRLPDLSQSITHQATYGPQVITSTNSNSYSQLKFRIIYSF